MKVGYYQISVSLEFVTHDGHYELLTMPFELVNVPLVFQSMMNNLKLSLQPGDVMITYL